MHTHTHTKGKKNPSTLFCEHQQKNPKLYMESKKIQNDPQSAKE